jgi:hypothetical protein
MTQESGNEVEKRQKALQRLRERRGTGRAASIDRRDNELLAAKMLIKGFRQYKGEDQDVLPSEEITNEILEASAVIPAEFEELESLAVPAETEDNMPQTGIPQRIAKVSKRLEQQDKEAVEAIQKMKLVLQESNARHKQKALERATLEHAQEKPEVSESAYSKISPAERQQLLTSLLSTDFLQNTTQWLSSAPTDPEISSSSPEEIEALHKRSKYRLKVLTVLMDTAQRELEAIELYRRNAQIWQSQTQSNA